MSPCLLARAVLATVVALGTLCANAQPGTAARMRAEAQALLEAFAPTATS